MPSVVGERGSPGYSQMPMPDETAGIHGFHDFRRSDIVTAAGVHLFSSRLEGAFAFGAPAICKIAAMGCPLLAMSFHLQSKISHLTSKVPHVPRTYSLRRRCCSAGA